MATINNTKSKKLLSGTSGNDTISNTGSNVTINAGAGNDYVYNEGANVSIDGGKGNDTILSGASYSTIAGGVGNDYVGLGGDANVYVYSAGNDTIGDFDELDTIVLGSVKVNSSVESGDTVQLKLSNKKTLTLTNFWADAINTVKSISDVKQINVIHNSTEGAKVKGTSQADFISNYANKVSINAGAGDDSIRGGGDYITISGGKGNDLIEKYGGVANVYVYSAGNDTISGFDEFDTIVLGSVKVSSSVRSDDYSTVTLKLSNKKTLTLTDCRADAINTVKSISDVKSWNIIRNTNNDTTVKGTSKADYIGNSGARATINGAAGNDYITNNKSYVSINAGKGNDTIINRGNGDYGTIRGGDGNDIIKNYGTLVTVTGDAGNDSILLNSTGNVVKYATGDGNDTIYGFNSTDTLSITGGSYSTQASGSDIVVTVGKEKITLKDVKGNAVYINKKNVGGKSTSKKFIALTSGNDTLTNHLDGVTISGGKGNDSIKSGGDKVSISGGAGNDTIICNLANNVTIDAGAGNDKIYNLDGQKVSINAGAGNDTISFRGNNSSLWGGKGNDTFIYDPSNGKNTIMDYQSGDLMQITDGTFSKSKFSGGTLTLTIGNGSLVFKDVTTSTNFNINGASYKISGSKLVKK